MTTLEDAERIIRKTGMRGRWISASVSRAIAHELDRLRAELDVWKNCAHKWSENKSAERIEARKDRLIEQLRAEVASLKGEAERTVYVGQTSPSGAVTDVLYGLGRTSEDLARQYKHCTQDVYAVHLSARKVET